ncbi:MAG: hypothetical protein GVY28_11920 [Alphaproteobacteria bacterium]|jgi:predicted AlkP superfamily phosphohydrolase/phosphomutase|nr:hypothetical protein [Alphaproteobacteria bacterium]
MPVTRNGLLILALDSVDPALTRRWIEAGHLPNLARLFEGASQAPTANPDGLVSGALWSSFFAGAGPGVHGQWDGVKGFDPVTYEKTDVDPASLQYTPFFKRLSDSGRRVGVIDATHTYHYPDLNGVQVVDWMTHVRVYGGGPMRTTPPELADTLIATFGEDPFPRGPACATDASSLETVDEVRTFLDGIHRRIDAKRDATLWLLEREDFEVFFVNLDMAHDAGHRLWHLFDPTVPDHRADLRAEIGDPLLPVYRHIDAVVGDLVAAAGPARTMTYLSHGMGRSETAAKTLDEILRRLETVYFGAPPAPPARTVKAALRRQWQRLPPDLRRRLTTLGGDRREHLRRELIAEDRRRRRFFEIYMFDSTGAVRLNVAGRDADGIVAPGAEAANLCARLKADLEALRNAETGDPVVDRVIVTDAVHPGPNRDMLPDLLIEWRRDQPIHRIVSPRFGEIVRQPHGVRSGDHTFDGRVLVNGPGIAPRRGNASIPCSALAPGIEHLLGLEDRPVDPAVAALFALDTLVDA